VARQGVAPLGGGRAFGAGTAIAHGQNPHGTQRRSEYNGCVLPIFTRPLDRLALRLGSRSVERSAVVPSRLSEAREYLERENIWGSCKGAIPDVSLRPPDGFEFRSAVTVAAAHSNTVHGRWFRCPGAWQERPAVILVHGWNDELNYRLAFPFLSRWLVRRGINAAILELPYHGDRRPRPPGAVRDFISEDLLQVVQATHQATTDLHSLREWLLSQGCPQVGLWGVSLGAWLTGLCVCADAQWSFAALVNPIARLDVTVAKLAFCAPIRRSLGDATLPWEALCLTQQRPLVAQDRLLIIKSEYDLIAEPEPIEELWRAWEQPEMWREPQGHISALLSIPVLRRLVRWVKDRSGAMAAKQ
jgi:hypothetical protein